jgi:hypothetical protein
VQHLFMIKYKSYNNGNSQNLKYIHM